MFEKENGRWSVWNERLSIAGGSSLLTAVLGAMALITIHEHNRWFMVQIKDKRKLNNALVDADMVFQAQVF